MTNEMYTKIVNLTAPVEGSKLPAWVRKAEALASAELTKREQRGLQKVLDRVTGDTVGQYCRSLDREVEAEAVRQLELPNGSGELAYQLRTLRSRVLATVYNRMAA